jgi:hypothetical protein
MTFENAEDALRIFKNILFARNYQSVTVTPVNQKRHFVVNADGELFYLKYEGESFNAVGYYIPQLKGKVAVTMNVEFADLAKKMKAKIIFAHGCAFYEILAVEFDLNSYPYKQKGGEVVKCMDIKKLRRWDR